MVTMRDRSRVILAAGSVAGAQSRSRRRAHRVLRADAVGLTDTVRSRWDLAGAVALVGAEEEAWEVVQERGREDREEELA